jgi:GWxTD domain-containing protein
MVPMMLAVPRSWLGAALVTAAVLPARLAAQAPEARARLDSLVAAFAQIPDSTVLLAMEASRIAYAKQHREDPMIHLELGLLAYRLGELTVGTKHYDDAAGEFEWASDLRPNWPTPWYWLGRAELAVGESRVMPLENIRQALGLDALSKGARAFARAAQADPSYSQALVDLANTALRQRIAPRLDLAQRALRLAAATPAGRLPAVLLARGQVERELDDRDSALVAFRAYLAAGGDNGVGHIEEARTLALLGFPDSAVVAYFAAARPPVSDAGREQFRRDLAWIATPEELTAFDRAPADSLGRWLREFWSRRDVEDARRPGARLVEQFRRYAYAHAHFRLSTRHRHYDIADAYRDTTQQEFDDRGVIYMRHGAPDQRATYVDRYVEPNETWVYRRPAPEHDLVFNFVASGHVQDYKLVESLLDVYGFSTALIVQTMPAGSPDHDLANAVVSGLIDSRSGIAPIYERLARVGAAGRGALLADERSEGRRSVRTGTTTDSYALRFDRDLDPVISSFVLADTARRPVLHVVFALPAAGLRAYPAPGGVGYPFEFRVIVYDSSLQSVAALDTVRVFVRGTPPPDGSYLTEQLAVPVPPGHWHYHFVVEELQADAGALVSGRDIDVPRTDSGFAVSDLVLGRIGSGLVLHRPGGAIPLAPLLQFPRDGTVELYYELYGLPQGAAVPTRVSVEPAGGRSLFHRIFGGGHGVNLEYVTVTDAQGRARVQQQLVLTGLARGHYVLTVELRDEASGRKVARRQAFEIAGARAP